MSTSINASLGVAFLVLSIVTTYTMFQFWGYPYDKETRKSECPQWKMNIHRVLGVAYAVVYVVLMIQMVPRMWEYQIEFPARTVAHMMLGITIGILLVIKLSILRFFRHFEEWMPVLGTCLLVCTVLLSALSLPFVARERALADAAVGGSVVSEANRARVAVQLARAKLPEGADVATLSTADSLMAGRSVLLDKCVYCHDLKTSIAKPRTAADWWRTVVRMAEKPTLGPQLSPQDMLHATAYLVAITPDLQDSLQDKRGRERERKKVAEAMTAPPAPTVDGGVAAAPALDLAEAKTLYEDVCAQCHDLSDVDEDPPKTAADATELMQRMIDNGLDEDPVTLKKIEAYLVATFVEPQ